MNLRARLSRLEEKHQRREEHHTPAGVVVRFIAPDGTVTAVYDPQTRQTLPAEQWEAVDVLRAVGLAELAEELGPAGAVEWLAQNDTAFAGCSETEIRRIAGGEEPAEVLGAERAATADLKKH